MRALNLHKLTVQIGRDDRGIAAVCAYSADWTDAFVFLGVAAVRIDLHRQGIGRSVMERFLSEITAGALDRDLYSIRIGTNVEPTNEPSLKLLSRWAWQYTGQQAGLVHRWETYILVGGAAG